MTVWIRDRRSLWASAGCIQRLCNRPMIPHGQAASNQPLRLIFFSSGIRSFANGVCPHTLRNRFILSGGASMSLIDGCWRHSTATKVKTYKVPVDAVICTRVSIDAHSLPRCRSQTASEARRGQPSPSRIQVLERRPAPVEPVGHSSAASETLSFGPLGAVCPVCHVSLTGLKQCPDPLNSPFQAA